MQTQFRSFVAGNVINFSVTLAGLILLTLGLMLARDAWQSRQAISRMEQTNAVVEALLDATDAQARERGLVAALLGDKPPGVVPEGLLTLREEVDRNWQAVNRLMMTVNHERSIPESVKSRGEELYRALDKFRQMRTAVDDHLLTRGSDVTLDQWFDSTTELNARAVALRRELMLAVRLPEQLMRLNFLVRDNGAVVAESAGQVRGLVAYYTAKQSPMPAEARSRAEFAHHYARQHLSALVEAAEEMAGGEMEGQSDIAKQLERLDLELYPVAQKMLAAASDGDYPYTADEWYELTTDNINRVFKLVDTASEQVVMQLRENARHELVTLFLFVALAVLAMSLGVMSLRRVRANAEQVFLQKETAETILNSVADAVIAVDARGCIHYVNPIAEELTGWKLGEARDKHYSEVFRLYNRLHTSQTDPLGACLEQGMVVVLSEGHAIVDRNGEEIGIDDSCAPIRDQHGEIAGAVVVFSSKDRQRNSDRILTYHATRDVLTELYNRRAFEKNLRELIEHARDSDARHTLAFIDVDNFKVVNDSGGHAAGDQLLRQIVFIMQQHVRDTDVLGRIGGDEFGLLLKLCTGDQACKVVEKLQEAIREFRFAWKDNIFQVGLSIGLVEINASSSCVEESIREADAACYAAKEKGRNHIQLYLPGDVELAQRQGQMQWVGRITGALDNDHFELYCQEIRPLKTGLPMHGEILVRMRGYDNDKLIPPNTFIPAAERHGLMPDIDRWVVEHLSQKASRVLKSNPDLHVNINLSGKTLSDPEAVASLANIIRQNGIRPGQICFEVTETAAIASLNTTVTLMEHMRREGFMFALDDFGSGLSSLNYLKSLPVDMLKIDGTFTRRLDNDVVARAMLEAITKIAGMMKVHTCAEYVENDTVLALLNEIGVDYGQGYLFHRPSPLDDCLNGYCDPPIDKLIRKTG